MKTLKLLDVWKKYDRCLVRENMRLKKIYNNLLKESEGIENERDEFGECDAFNEEDDEPAKPMDEAGFPGGREIISVVADPAGGHLEGEVEDIMSEEDFFEAVEDEPSKPLDEEDDEPAKPMDEAGFPGGREIISVVADPAGGHLEGEVEDIMSEEDFFEAVEDEAKEEDESVSCNEYDKMVDEALEAKDEEENSADNNETEEEDEAEEASKSKSKSAGDEPKSAEDFFAETDDENEDETGDDAGDAPAKSQKSSSKAVDDPDMMTAEEFFGTANESEDSADQSNESTSPNPDEVSAEFFNEEDDDTNESKCPDCGKDPCECPESEEDDGS